LYTSNHESSIALGDICWMGSRTTPVLLKRIDNESPKGCSFQYGKEWAKLGYLVSIAVSRALVTDDAHIMSGLASMIASADP
jgi:hypothetical protein